MHVAKRLNMNARVKSSEMLSSALIHPVINGAAIKPKTKMAKDIPIALRMLEPDNT
ncbi:hypothetical protein SDC9_159467 [bioreactor metagenome]|uniref:Uncharacterized protein n=1 Tax=bioreactor metagenome TaxID=1076179 RepID=A0A645FCP7_9ZZZZ